MAVAAWAEPILALLGLLTLGGALRVWSERWRIANLRVGRRAYRARRVMHLGKTAADLVAEFAAGREWLPAR